MFLKKVFDGFCDCGGLSSNKIGIAVSGGADSVSLLLSAVEIFGCEKIFVITVNHNIRSEDETKGDADFVFELCQKLGVFCKVFEIERGKIEKLSKERNGGIEESARFLRYQAFEEFILEKNLDFLCLAHNQNDQLETALMRFLQGSGCDGGGGIAQKRNKFIRPLLSISRCEIEEYLKSKNQIWKTDSTNLDTNYLRNKIRNILMPNLDSLFEGWRKAVLNGTEKNRDDEEILENIVSDLENSISVSENEVSFSRKKFDSLSNGIKRRLVHKMLSKINFSSRFPYKLIKQIFEWNDEKNHTLQFENICIFADSVFSIKIIKKVESKNILESGFYQICEIENKKFVVRSFVNGDEIKMKDGKMKSIAKIFSEWKVEKSLKEKIQIVQNCEDLEIVAILGEKFGYKNWIVQGFEFVTNI